MRQGLCSMHIVKPAKRTLCVITASGLLRRQPTAHVEATNMPAVLFTGTRVGHKAGCIPCDGMPEPAASHHPRQARCSGIGPIGNACCCRWALTFNIKTALRQPTNTKEPV